MLALCRGARESEPKSSLECFATLIADDFALVRFIRLVPTAICRQYAAVISNLSEDDGAEFARWAVLCGVAGTGVSAVGDVTARRFTESIQIGCTVVHDVISAAKGYRLEAQEAPSISQSVQEELAQLESEFAMPHAGEDDGEPRDQSVIAEIRQALLSRLQLAYSVVSALPRSNPGEKEELGISTMSDDLGQMDLSDETEGSVTIIQNLRQRNTAYEDRTGIIKAMARAITATGRVVLSGPGGNGKSSLAKAYSYMSLDEKKYRLIWQMEARSHEEIEIGFRALAAAIGVDTEKATLHAIIKRVRKRLADSPDLSPYLIILDDARTEVQLFDILGGELPTGLVSGVTGHVVITSRSPQWEAAPCVMVHVFSQQEALHFLTRNLPAASPGSLLALASSLGFHPLALSQAAGYINKTKCPIESFSLTL